MTAQCGDLQSRDAAGPPCVVSPEGPEPGSTATDLALLAANLEASLDGILVVDANDKVAYANRRFAEMSGDPA